MKKAWKWILGILIVLVVVAALVAVPFAMRNFMAARVTRVAVNNNQQSQQPQAPQGFDGGPMMGRGNNRGDYGFTGRMPGRFNNQGGPMMGGRFGGFNRGFGVFGLGAMFIGGLLRLIPLALFGLLLFGVYQLGKRSGMRSAPVVVPSPAPVAPASVVVDAPQDDQTPTV